MCGSVEDDAGGSIIHYVGRAEPCSALAIAIGENEEATEKIHILRDVCPQWTMRTPIKC